MNNKELAQKDFDELLEPFYGPDIKYIGEDESNVEYGEMALIANIVSDNYSEWIENIKNSDKFTYESATDDYIQNTEYGQIAIHISNKDNYITIAVYFEINDNFDEEFESLIPITEEVIDDYKNPTIFDVSFKKDNIYQARYVKAYDEDQVKKYFDEEEPNAEYLGAKDIGMRSILKPGKPIDDLTKLENKSIKLIKENISWNSFDKFESVIDKYLPSTGEGDTMASQIVTAVNKLIYKWYNDGDVFDNRYRLEGWLNNLSSYANWLDKYIPESKNILTKITDIHSDNEYSELLYNLATITLNDDFLKDYSTKDKVGSIYNCKGPYIFEEENYDEDDEEDWDEFWEEETESIVPIKEKTSLDDYQRIIYDGLDNIVILADSYDGAEDDINFEKLNLVFERIEEEIENIKNNINL